MFSTNFDNVAFVASTIVLKVLILEEQLCDSCFMHTSKYLDVLEITTVHNDLQ